MPNVIRYTTGSETLALKKGNFYIGVGDVGKGPTSTTGYYNGIAPPSGGYTIYLNKESNGPSIYTVENDAQLISLTNTIAGASYTEIQQCFTYFATQNDKMVVNKNYSPIITNGLLYNFDGSFLPSYPQSGSSWYSVGTSYVTGSLFNGPTFATYGGLNFDGSDDSFNYTDNTNRLGFTNSITMQITIMTTSSGNTTQSDFLLLGFDPSAGSQLNFYRNNGWPTDYFGLLAYFDPGGYVNEWAYYEPNRFYTSTISLASDGTYYLMQNGTITKSGQFTTGFTRWRVNFSELALNGRGLGRIPCVYRDVKLYNRGLSLSEILQNYYQGPIVTSGLVFNYDISSVVSYYGSGTTLYNMSSSSNNSTLTNGPTYSLDSSGCLVLDGSDDYLNCGSIDIRGGFTFEIWTKANSFTNEYGLLGQGTGLAKQGLHILYNSGARGMIFGMYFNDADYGNNYRPSTNVWYHWVFTYNGSTYAKQFYADGVLQTASSLTQSDYTGTGQLNIGAIYSAALSPMNGKIGCARLYNRVLSASEISQNYNAQVNRYK